GYRATRHKAGRRLAWTVAVATLLTAGLLLSAAVLFLSPRERPPSPLEQKIEALRYADRATAAERLSVPPEVLEKRLEQFKAVRDDRGFADLPDSKRAFVSSRLEELEKYLALFNYLLPLRPADALEEKEVETVRVGLLLPSHQPPDDWKGTDVAEMYAARL